MKTTALNPRVMKRAAMPLAPHELVQVRALLASGDPRPDLDAGVVATRLGLARRTVLDLCGKVDGFPNAWKPSHNRVRIPAADVDAYRAHRLVMPSPSHSDG